MYDCIIVGGGPAGLTAALYTLRAGLSTLLLEQFSVGGQAALAANIENYPGVPPTDGFTLAMAMHASAVHLGLETRYEKVTAIDPQKKTVSTPEGVYEGRTLILCMGARERELGLENEKSLVGRGVSYCATCDGNFFRNKTVAVVGGGDTAVKDTLYLQNICAKVRLIHRREQFRAGDFDLGRIDRRKVEFFLNHRIVKLWEREGRLAQIVLEDGTALPVDGLFVAVGRLPNTSLLPSSMLEEGFIRTDADMRTDFPGVFAAGDVRVKSLRQVVTAAGDGATAAHSAIQFVK